MVQSGGTEGEGLDGFALVNDALLDGGLLNNLAASEELLIDCG